VIELARHFLDGRLSTELLSNGTNEEISKALIAVRGIGQVSHRIVFPVGRSHTAVDSRYVPHVLSPST
jgi:hypothetical protein